MKTEFIISQAEIARRKRAFVTLVCSLLAGLIATSTKFITTYPEAAIIILCIVILFLAFSSIATFKFLNSISKTRISLHEEYLQRDDGNKVEMFPLSDITKILIKRTTRKTIRRITLIFNNKPPVVLNGLEDCEHFKNALVSNIGKNIILRESYEPLDFDHPLFYVLLGLLISIASITVLKLVIAYRILENSIAFTLLSLFPAAVGLYFIFQKPLAREYGAQRQKTDYLWGLLLICSGIILYFLGR